MYLGALENHGRFVQLRHCIFESVAEQDLRWAQMAVAVWGVSQLKEGPHDFVVIDAAVWANVFFQEALCYAYCNFCTNCGKYADEREW